MNSYHLAILQATSHGRFPGLCDIWRNYHPNSVMSDSDYQYMTDTGDISVVDQEDLNFIHSSDTNSPFAVFGGVCEGRSAPGKNCRKILYVPVTRKVILTTEKKAQKLHSGMIQK